MAKFFADNTQIDQENALLSQLYVMDDSKTVAKFLESKDAKAVTFARLKLAKVSKKLLTTLKLKCKQQWLQHSKIKSHIAIIRRYD